MHKYLEINNILIYFPLLVLGLNVLPKIGKYRPTTRGTCTPDWEPLSLSIVKQTRGNMNR